MFIDSHCHLNFRKSEEGAPSPEEIIAAAKANQVDGMLTICCEIHKEKEELKTLASAHDNVWCSIGTHPHDAGQEDEKNYTDQDIAALTEHPKVIAIGETGLDYYYMNSSKEDQQEGFKKHIRACLETDLPVIVHSRDAEEDTIQILKEHGQPSGLTGVMHCFSSGPKLAEGAREIDFYMSFAGILTFKKAEELRQIAKDVPLDRLLIETDSPFLAPEPFRGKPNEPKNVYRVCETLAELHDMKTEEMARITSENFYRLFKKAGTL